MTLISTTRDQNGFQRKQVRPALVFLTAVGFLATAVISPVDADEPPVTASIAPLSARIDELTSAHWQCQNIAPADLSGDQEFLRRVTLDLIGRIPTRGEAQSFANDASPDKRSRTIERLMASPEYALHWASVLDGILQDRSISERQARDGEFTKYLRKQVESRRPWDAIFRDVMLGPWEGDAKPAEAFLRKRLNNIDDLTNDTARVFFGVNISCAKCHDHPLVDDWKQAHYYGMQSFFNRTYEDKKLKVIGEKDSGDVQFVDTSGNRHTAQIMFLSGQVVELDGRRHDPRLKERIKAAQEKGQYMPPPFSPRQELVDLALQQKSFFSRAIANRLWAYFFGRGLVHPVDQLHSANPPSVAGVLELLADDLAGDHSGKGGYDLRRTVAAIVGSRTYQFASQSNAAERPRTDGLGAEGRSAEGYGPEHFAVAQLRPLSPTQFAVSMLVAVGEEKFDQLASADEQRKLHEQWEGQAGQFTKLLDAPSDDFQSSIGEALFMTNHPAVQKLTEPSGQNLTARLAGMADASPKAQIESAYWCVLGRAPEAEELEYLEKWLADRPDRTRGCRDLVWSLVTSAEFRFNH